MMWLRLNGARCSQACNAIRAIELNAVKPNARSTLTHCVHSLYPFHTVNHLVHFVKPKPIFSLGYHSRRVCGGQNTANSMCEP